jgi:protein ImuB
MKKPAKSKNTQEIAAQVHHILEILHKWGIHTLGQLAALDREELGARLGPEAAHLWERANGKVARLLKLVQPPESFVESFEFENEIETAEPLLFMLRRFLGQLSLRLSAVYLVAKELTLRITFANPPQDGSAVADKQRYERCFKIPQPTNDIDLLFRMLQTHLENFTSEHPIVAVALDAQPVKPAAQQFGLFETALRDPNQLSETLARLTGLLGADRVGTPVLEETHRPDAFHLEPFSWQVDPASSQVGAIDLFGFPSHHSGQAGQALNRPVLSERLPRAALRRFRPSSAASMLLDENNPAHLRSVEISGKVAAQKGPYAISGNWWDEKAWSRAEWDLQLENDVLVRCHESEETWELDGIYD